MPGNQKAARCLCCGCTTGCCIPIDHSNPLYEPWGTPSNIPFMIDAPSCPEIDGYAGELVCGGTSPVTQVGSCGPCVSCIGGGPDDGGWNLFATRRIEFPLPLGCQQDSCNIILCLHLECKNATADNEQVEACCQKFRLLIGIQAGTSSHIDNEDPDITVIASPCGSWRRVLPLVCECGATESDFPAIIFPLNFSVDCDEQYTDECIGFSKCCDTLIGCDLSDATLVI